MNRQILRIALPSVITTITVPLLSLVDLGLSGHLENASSMGAIAVGGTVFNLIYWLFGFLRASTSGLTAQAYGADCRDEVVAVLVRSAIVATAVGAVIIVLQQPIQSLMLWIMNPSAAVTAETLRYCSILFFGAPAVLLSFCFAGWFLGMQEARTVMVVSIVQNLVNILLSLFLVKYRHWGIEGIAWGTLVAQWFAVVAYSVYWCLYHGSLTKRIRRALIFNSSNFIRFLSSNRDLLLRTICLILVQTYFTRFGANYSDTILALNAILLQFFMLFSYFMDALAYAAESLGGYYVGSTEYNQLRQLRRSLFRWGWALTLVATLIICLGYNFLISILTDNSAVISESGAYRGYILLVPICGFAAFLFDGLFLGAMATRPMFYALFFSSALFFLLTTSLSPFVGNQALWIAYLAYLLLRSVLSNFYFNKILNAYTEKNL